MYFLYAIASQGEMRTGGWRTVRLTLSMCDLSGRDYIRSNIIFKKKLR